MRAHSAGRLDLVLQRLQELTATGDDQGRDALAGEHAGDLPSDSDAASGYYRSMTAKLKVHRSLLGFVLRCIVAAPGGVSTDGPRPTVRNASSRERAAAIRVRSDTATTRARNNDD